MSMLFLSIIFIIVLIGLGWTLSATGIDMSFYEVNTTLSRRENVIDITDYGCGAKVFCNSSLAKYQDQCYYHCMKCKCDDICSFYGDCCPDRLFDERTDLPIPPSPHISCLRQHPRSTIPGDNPYMFLVTSCPEDSNADQVTKSKCEHPNSTSLKQSTPVSVKATGITYKNVYCAICHHQNGYKGWRHEATCSRTDFLSSARVIDELWSFVTKEELCLLKSIPPVNVDTRTCYPGLQEHCNSTGRWEKRDKRIEELCHQYYSPVDSGFRKYRNIFCSLCDGDKLSRGRLCHRISSSGWSRIKFPLSVLIVFSTKPQLMAPSTTAEVTLSKCNNTELYDPISNNCRPAECSLGRVLSDGECEVILETLAGVGYSASMALTFSEDMSLTQWSELLFEYNRYLRSELQQYNPFMLFRMVQALYTTTYTIGDNARNSMRVNGASMVFDFVSTSAKHILDFEDKFRNLHLAKSNFTIGNITGILSSTPIPCYSSWNKVLEGRPEKSFRRQDPPFSDCQHHICDFSAVIYRPILHILDCPHLAFRLSEYNLTFNYENSSIGVSNQTIYLEESKFWICDDVIKICSSGLSRIYQMINKSSPKEPVVGVRGPTSGYPARTTVSPVCVFLCVLSIELAIVL